MFKEFLLIYNSFTYFRIKVVFQYMYTMCNDQIKVTGITITLNSYNFLVLGTLKNPIY